MLFLALKLFVLYQKSKQTTEEKQSEQKNVYRSLAFDGIPSKSRWTKMDMLAYFRIL